jgi:hypothetical protein
VVTLTSLWLPFLVSIGVVFVVSSLIHMVMPWHKNDYPAVPNEDAVLDALRPFSIPPGDYMMPRGTGMADMKSKEFQEKMRRGPVVIMSVLPNGITGMGGTMVQWVIFIAVVTHFGAYIASRALGPGADYLEVFRFVGTVTFVGYSLAAWPLTIWYGRGASLAIKTTFDAAIYGLLTAGVFGWLWPR